MKSIWKSLLLGAGLVAAASAQPACSTLTLLSDVIGTDCTLGDSFVLKNVQYSRSDLGGELASSQVNFSASYALGVISVGLSGAFQAPTSGTHTYQISFLVDPPPEVIIGFDADIDWGSTTNSLSTQAGSGSLAGSLCSGASFTDTPPSPSFCPAVFSGFLSNPANPGASVTFPATNIVDVHLLLTLSDGAQLVSIFTQTQSTLAPRVPEPAVGLAAGAIGLALIARRRRQAA